MSLSLAEEFRLIQQAKLLQYANNKRIDGDFNDVTVEVGGESIPANRMVLACYSKFFESMFLSPMKEKYQNTVVIKDFNGKAVKHVIDYIYSGQIDINTNNVLILLKIADFLHVDDVKKMCFDFMETSLTVDSCLDVIKALILYNYPSIQQTYQFINDNFDEIMRGDKFKQLSKDELMSLNANLDRSIVQERSLYTAIINWIKYDQSRQNEFVSLFLTLDLQNVPSKFVASTIAKEPLVKLNNDCINAVVSYFADRTLNIREATTASKILCIGGEKTKSVSEIYNISDKSWNNYPDLPYILSYCRVFKLKDFIYCVGGKEDGFFPVNPTNKVYRLNLKDLNSGWQEVASMAEKRSKFGAAESNGCLVVAGGYNGNSKLSTTELYQPSLNIWRSITPLNGKRVKHVLAVSGEKLFAIGGLNNHGSCLKSMQQFCSVDGTWKEVESMNAQRKCFAAVTYKNFIYAIGGCKSTLETLNSVEKYDTYTDKWTLVKSMNEKRRNHAACVLEEKIFVVGGKDDEGNGVKAIESYDPLTDEWTVVGETEEVFGHAIVAV